MRTKGNLLKLLGVDHPVILAPLAGGPSTPALAAAVSNAGALGSLGGAYERPEAIDTLIQKTRQQTTKPFAVNLFAPQAEPLVTPEQIKSALAATEDYRRELGIPTPPDLTPPFAHDFEKEFEAVLSGAPAVFSFTFGLVSREHLAACRKRGILTIGTATTLEEALALQDSGVDAVVAQGVEAGGHRGVFSASSPDPAINTLDLTRDLASNLEIPVIAAGAIMDGAGIRAALNAGAQAVQLGTAFLLCDEAGTSQAYRKALTSPGPKNTRLTKVFSGRNARGLENRFMLEMEAKGASILPFPAQNNLTRDIRKKATQLDRPEYLSLWAGKGVHRLRKMPAADLVQTLVKELAAASHQSLVKD